jgi:hypothetical protein
MGRTLTIDLSQPLSPAEKLTLERIARRQPKPKPVTQGVQQALDECLGEQK